MMAPMIQYYYTPCLKNSANLFVSELCPVSTNFDKHLTENGKEAKIMRGALIFHLT